MTPTLTVMTARQVTALLAVLAAVIAGAFWLTSGGHTESRADQRFLNVTGQNPALAQLTVQEQLTYGHEYCDLLAQHNGDTTRTDAQLAGQARLFTAPVLHTLRIAATTAYCP